MPEKIGLEGVFQTASFSSGLKLYTTGLTDAAKKTTEKGGEMAASLSKFVSGAATAFLSLGVAAVAAIGAVSGIIAKLVFDAAKMADTFSQMSEVTGISATRLQELAYAGKLLDVDLETITGSMRFLTRNMWSARDGTGEVAEAFKELGISTVDSKGELRDANVVFGEMIDALGKIKNPTERDAIAMKVMGRSAMELNPLINAGSKALAQFSQEAHDMGAVLDEDTISSLDKFQDQMDAMKLTFKVISARIASAFLPAFQDIINVLRQIALNPAFQKWLQDIIDNLGKFTDSILGGGTIDEALSYLGNIWKSLPKISMLDILGKAEEFAAEIRAWVDSIDWSEISSGLATYIAGIPWSDYGEKIGNMLSDLGNAIKIMISETEWTELFKSAGTAIGDLIAGAVVDGLTWDEAWEKQWGGTLDLLAEMVSNYGWADVGGRIAAEIIKGIMASIAIAMNNLGLFVNIPGVEVDKGDPNKTVTPTTPVIPIKRGGGKTGGPTYFGMAEGGLVNVMRPTLFLAGERGPERALFMPMTGGGGGQSIYNSPIVNIYATVSNNVDIETMAYRVATVIARRV